MTLYHSAIIIVAKVMTLWLDVNNTYCYPKGHNHHHKWVLWGSGTHSKNLPKIRLHFAIFSIKNTSVLCTNANANATAMSIFSCCTSMLYKTPFCDHYFVNMH